MTNKKSLKVGDIDPVSGMEFNVMEHTNITLWTHSKDTCIGMPCTIHKMSNHSMRSFPQSWRADRGIMERLCEHSVGHPDPDDFNVILYPSDRVHGCDGCCAESN